MGDSLTPCYNRMGTPSRRAMLRRYQRGCLLGDVRCTYIYRPRGNLLQRLAGELGLSVWQVREQITKERRHLLNLMGYDVKPWEPV